VNIAKISFRSGLIDTIEQKSACKEYTLRGEEIPVEIRQIFNSDKVWQLCGKWGNPEWGEPIQYQWALVELDNGKLYEFEVYNLAIMMYQSEDEKVKRLFRFIVRVERCIKRHEQGKA
jgi:hypothetical protein